MVITIRNKKYRVETALTSIEMSLGLSGRNELPPDGGMIFVSATPDSLPIWMKETSLDLDVLWLDADRKIVHMASLPAETSEFCARDESPNSAYFVLEISSGEIASGGFSLGDEVFFG